MKSFQIVYNDGTTDLLVEKPVIEGYRLPSGRKFARLKHDFELYGVSRPTYRGDKPHTLGLPETVKALYPVSVPLREEWQIFAADLLSLSRFRKLYKDLNSNEREIIKLAFASTYRGFRAFTNRFGPNNGYADYINKTNVNNEPIKQETINTGGNIVELLSGKIRQAGKDVFKVRILNIANKPPDPRDVEPWLIVKATNSQREKILNEKGVWTGRWIENIVHPFPQLQGYDVPVAWVGKGDSNYIEANRIIELPDNAIVPSPYHKYIR